MASVIKAGQITPGGTAIQHTEFNWEDMSVNAARYLDTVRKQAEQIVASAQQQARQIAAQAAARGHQTALQEARTAALAEVQTRWQTLTPMFQQLRESLTLAQSRWQRDWEDRAVHLAVAIAQRLVRGELSRQPRISQQWIREALELAAGCRTITLRLHPDDFAAVGDWRELLARELAARAPTQIVPDPGVERGGCHVDTEFGSIDQQLTSQLARIEEELTGTP
ncbi:MAG: flagellar assembly protein FliH [Pirellulaceae bacterium]|jgi:flagellar assembly protein FliH|nr:flagellar assembly protein FliH [Pirellulaceae bacterium]